MKLKKYIKALQKIEKKYGGDLECYYVYDDSETVARELNNEPTPCITEKTDVGIEFYSIYDIEKYPGLKNRKKDSVIIN